jgi:hypothetical protein
MKRKAHPGAITAWRHWTSISWQEEHSNRCGSSSSRVLMSFDILCSLQLVKLNIQEDPRFPPAQWRLCLIYMAPTLKHFDVAGASIVDITPTVTLPHLETLSIQDLGYEACWKIQAPQASLFEIEDHECFRDEEYEGVGEGYAGGINQRFQKSTTRRDSFRLVYHHQDHISLMTHNEVLEFFIQVPAAMPILGSLCLALNAHIARTITRLELLPATPIQEWRTSRWTMRQFMEIWQDV